jgi:hypothetical protein
MAAFTAVIAAATVVYAILTKRLLNTTKQSADAAKLNAQAVLDSERPWVDVVVVPNKDRPGCFFFRAVNKGRTPAKLSSGDVVLDLRSRPDDLPVPPKYDHSPFFAPNERFLANGESFDIHVTSAEQNTGVDAEGRIKARPVTADPLVFLCVFGRIVYEGALCRSSTGNAKYETRFCYAYFRNESRFLKSGPREYNSYT